MDDGEGELALSKVLAEPLVRGVLSRVILVVGEEEGRDGTDLSGLEVDVVVADLEDDANQVGEGNVVPT
jgi:hypothetical protein